MHVCLCMPDKKREAKTEREKQRQRERGIQRDMYTERQAHTQRASHTAIETERENIFCSVHGGCWRESTAATYASLQTPMECVLNFYVVIASQIITFLIFYTDP